MLTCAAGCFSPFFSDFLQWLHSMPPNWCCLVGGYPQSSVQVHPYRLLPRGTLKGHIQCQWLFKRRARIAKGVFIPQLLLCPQKAPGKAAAECEGAIAAGLAGAPMAPRRLPLVSIFILNHDLRDSEPSASVPLPAPPCHLLSGFAWLSRPLLVCRLPSGPSSLHFSLHRRR